MLAVFSGDRSPTPKASSSKLVDAFAQRFPSLVSTNVGSLATILYSHDAQNSSRQRSFAVKDDIFCVFEGTLENLGSMKQYYGLAKNANEVVLMIEAYKALRDRAPYPTNRMLGHLDGSFAFVVFDKATSRVLVASDQDGKVPLYMGITADGCLAFCDDAEILRSACGKSLATFPPGCFFSTSSGLTSYEHPKNKVTAIPATEEEMWGATFKIERPHVKATDVDLGRDCIRIMGTI
ncbi:uncharacterized protein A4U43_C01F29850 [Asparagus officinalis]|uniref:DUF3700 domain-containing protein n=1 Tax=Asparagus officinalis TaxID=4686 RepID=A0A5P1FV12_ASPOF|nr:uncharacterized protein LOC109840069 [Asparagus officinalis]ONK81503.1 uncharacterized protein A4U43_C01F29850 [Asparagus officinalis]